MMHKMHTGAEHVLFFNQYFLVIPGCWVGGWGEGARRPHCTDWVVQVQGTYMVDLKRAQPFIQ